MQQVDDPPSLSVGTEVSAKYKGAFCEAKVSKVVRNIKVKVAYKHGLGSGAVSDDAVKSGLLRVGSVVEVKHPERKETVEATVTKIQDCSQYTVVFDDGDITTLRRTALCLKSGRHFNESETLDQLPLTHPEHFGNPVVGGRRGRRRHMNDDSSDDEDESDTKEVVNEKEENIGKVVCVEIESKKKDKEKWFPGLVVSPNAQATVRIRVKDEYLVRSFKDGRYYTVPKKEATEFTREAAAKQDGPAVQAALEYLDSDVLPAHWDRDALFGLSNSSSEEDAEIESDSSDDEPREEKDRFVAQLYKYMDDRGTPLNKVPSIQSRDVDLYRLFRAVQKRGGYNRVTTQNQWKSIALRLGFTPVTVSIANLVKQAYKKFLQPYGEFHRKLGCSMLTPRNSNRSKGRSLVRANSVASPKLAEVINKDCTNTTSIGIVAKLVSTPTPHTVSCIVSSSAPSPIGTTAATTCSVVATQPSSSTIQSGAEESENTSESSIETSKIKSKTSVSTSKMKSLIEKYEEKACLLMKDEGDVPLSKMKAVVVASSRAEDKEIGLSSIRDTKDIVIVPMQTANTRENSPTASPGSLKKEKLQRKHTLQNEQSEKRGKRKKDEVSVEKVDIGDFLVEIGDKLKVYYHEKKVTYEAKVIEITLQRGVPMYLVHYTGWNNRYDEWVPRERIAENLTKVSKQKGRAANIAQSSQDKSKENPPKPLIATQASTTVSVPSTTIPTLLGNISASTKAPTPTSVRRGRGRSDSLPPRSTTPSSVASNSSRTKSPAASSASLKKRPILTHHSSSTNRRISTNVSDISIPTETDSDSDDEPVRRPTRTTKDMLYKGSESTGAKAKVKHTTSSASRNNSQTDESDDEDEDEASIPPSCRAINASSIGTKGRDYDLNQIRSELKGFHELKSPSSEEDATTDNKGNKPNEDVLKLESRGELLKTKSKDEPIKSSATDISSETDSFADDDSQSSDKTTTLENMTKKFQQKINADKQRALVKVPSGKIVSDKLSNLQKTHIVEKIIKDSLAEKRQETLKANPTSLGIVEDSKLIKIELDLPSISPVKAMIHAESGRSTIIVNDEDKKTPVSTIGVETKKSAIIAPARFNTGLGGSSKFHSVIVDKPLNVSNNKKGDREAKEDSPHVKKHDTSKKLLLTEGLNKKAIEQSAPLSKDQVTKVDPPAACSPTSSSSSSSSSSSTSSQSASTRSLPDMSKLDISGCSSTSSSTPAHRDTRVGSAAILKPNSPDIYEFKDPEPFEYEIRKSALTPLSAVAGCTPLTATTSTISSIFDNKRKISSQKMGVSLESSASIINPLTAIVNRKKRGSPMKDSNTEQTKQIKIDEKHPLVLEAKLTLRGSTTNQSISSVTASSITKSSAAAQNKILPQHPSSSSFTNQSGTGSVVKTVFTLLSRPNPTSLQGLQKHEQFDTLRMSPSFNLNINALNEELAQTVQETTRALTDALHTIPTVDQLTPVKAATPTTASTTKSNAYGANETLTVTSRISTPPTSTAEVTTKVVVGSPFIETREDLKNVFELSTIENDTSGSTSCNKDNKFELENVKILLSHSASAFDLGPGKFENKPTSIADKVLKAISKKKEVEIKNKEIKQTDLYSKDVASSGSTGLYKPMETIEALEIISRSTEKSLKTSVTNTLTSTSRPTITDLSKQLDPSAVECLTTDTGKDKSSAKSSQISVLPVTTQLSKSSNLGSPDTRLGILESISVKNNDLSETIQKLECALQKKTPVPSTSSSLRAMVTTSSLSSTATAAATSTSAFTDDSIESTDSERRLIIEDVEEQSRGGDYRKSPLEGKQILESKITTVISLQSAPIKGDATSIGSSGDSSFKTTAVTLAIPPNLQTPPTIPANVLACGKSNANTGVPDVTSTSSKFGGKLHGNTPAIVLTAKSSTPIQQSLIPIKQIQQQSQQTISSIQTSHTLPQGMRLTPVIPKGSGEDTSISRSISQFTCNQEATSSLKAISSQIAHRTAASVIPIVLPDIPVSVVVASSAVPSVVAAAQAAAAAAQKISTHTTQQANTTVKAASTLAVATTTVTALLHSMNSQTSSFSANSASLKTFENAAAVRNVPLKPIGVVGPSPPLPVDTMVINSVNSTNTNTDFTQPNTVTSSSMFFLDTRNTNLRPDDGVRPIMNTFTDDDIDEKSNKADTDDNNTIVANLADGISLGDTHNDSINLLLCEETIPGSPAPIFGKDSPQLRNRNSAHVDDKVMGIEEIIEKDDTPTLSTTKNEKISCTAEVVNPTPTSSLNDSASQDEMSSDELKKNTGVDNEISPRKRRRTRKQSEMILQNEQQTKRRRQLITCGKKNNAGSDSDENSDTVSQQSITSARPHQQHQHQQQVQQQTSSAGGRSCPYNFLVQLDPLMNPDQRIAILLKQIQDLKKTYNMIKGDLASIDRRRKKLRRREREKKQIQQQQIKVLM